MKLQETDTVSFEGADPRDIPVPETEVPPDEVDVLDTPELNEATQRFMYGFARCSALATNMNGKGLARVYKAILGFPFEAHNTKFKNKTEHELFVLSISVLASKAVMGKAVSDSQTMLDIEDKATTAVAEAQFDKLLNDSAKAEKN